MTESLSYIVRPSTPEDAHLSRAASHLSVEASKTHDVAARTTEYTESKIKAGLAALSFYNEELVGFACVSPWNDKTLSHSSGVVAEAHRGQGLFKRMKEVLFQIGDAQYPNYDIICLTTSETVWKINQGHGYKPVPLQQLSSDPEFWDGCKGCLSYEKVNGKDSDSETNPVGTKCCCKGMRLYKSS